MVPNLDHVSLMARDVTQNPYPNSVMQFLFSSFLMPLIAYAVGLNKTPADYFALCALVLLVGMVLGFGSLRRRFDDETAHIVMLLFGATPLINVLLTRIGYGDPLTFTPTSNTANRRRLPRQLPATTRSQAAHVTFRSEKSSTSG